MPDKYLITSALPYANGPLHLGHMVEYIQTDIFVRFLRSCGHQVVYFCADDTHGTPIELNAAKHGLRPEEFVARFFEEHQKDFADFGVQFDQFSSTNSPENQHYAELIYGRLKEGGDIVRRDVEQTFCEKDQRFLPDRFVRGTCPNCKAPDQYGDACEKCGKAYATTDLIDPRCSLCGSTPVRKKSEHVFFKLSAHETFLRELIKRPEFLHSGLATQLLQFFDKGLADWDITRDGPYFGFAIPGETNKFFYVWLDAPIGYISTTEKWAKQTGKAKDATELWGEGSDWKIQHFIGKDILYFHALFWPAVLSRSQFKIPSKISVHGHLTLNGEKMSKSRGTLIAARTYLDKLDPSYLRYFYAASLGAGPEDLDLSLKDFRLRVNGELVNNLGNLANRGLTMLAEKLDRKLAPVGDGPGRKLVEDSLAKVPEIRAAFQELDYRSAIKGITGIGQAANGFLQEAAPWKTIKTDPERARRDLTDAAEVAYLLAALLEPVVPRLSEKLFTQLGATRLTFAQLAEAKYPLLDRTRPLGSPEPLIGRIEEGQAESMVPPEESNPPAPKKEKGATQASAPGAKPEAAPAAPVATQASPGAGAAPAGEIEYADFTKVILKVGRIVTAERVPKADKLLKLGVDVGEGSPRTICAGIAEAYTEPEKLVGRNVVVVANLKPRMLRGIESRGMLLAGGAGGPELSLVDPGPLPPGSDVK
ncbi:MAG: methionine--tRNA ligase [Myxococcota bacterium]|nr:methionine--tRNA ligase [Myxococcota bacterium]